MFISIIGLRGSGKTTQALLLEKSLASQGLDARIVKALDDDMKLKFLEVIKGNSSLANTFLYSMLYRRQVESINAIDNKGGIAIADRFIENFWLYHRFEGLLKTHGPAIYQTIESLIFEELRPTIWFYLKVDLKVANKRVQERIVSSTRSDYMFETNESYRRSLAVYNEICVNENCKIIDGHLEPFKAHQAILSELLPHISR